VRFKIFAILGATLASLGYATASYATTAAPKVNMHVAFMPYHPGAQTTVAVGFHVIGTDGKLPPPLTKLSISLPKGMGLGETDLGEATCSVATLKDFGPRGCPPNSLMGLGRGVAGAQIGPVRLEEPVAMTILMAKAQNEHTTLILQGEGYSPVAAEAIFMSQLLESGPGYGAELVTEIPLVRPVPEAPYMALMSMFTTFGPQHLTYFRQRGKARIAYKPRGIAIPRECPRHGYRFRATFDFLGYAPATVTAAVPCRGGGRRRGGKG
jgi:hypothetical protein